MATIKAHVFVTLKTEVLDPQGEAVKRSLNNLGFDQVAGVRVGKFIELELDDRHDTERQVRAMCEKLLANQVIENFRYEVVS